MADTEQTEQATITPDPDAQSPEDTQTQPPPENTGSGQFAVWNATLGQYVSGVGDKATATKMKKELGKAEHNGGPLEGHKLEVREV